MQYLIVGEKQCILELRRCISAVLHLIILYYIHDISYPKALEPILLFFKIMLK